MTNTHAIPDSIILKDESSNLSIENTYPEVENLTMFAMQLDSADTWMYYKYSAKDVFALNYIAAENKVYIIRLGCTALKTCQDAMLTIKGDIPFLDAKYPEWRNGNLFIMNYIKRKKVVPDDFGYLQPDTFAMNDTILLAKKDSKTNAAYTGRVYSIFAGRETNRHSLHSLLTIAKLYFAEKMANPSQGNYSYPPNKIGRALAYSLILGYFQARRGYITPNILGIDYELAPPLKSVFDEPLYDRVFRTTKLEEIGSGIRKTAVSNQPKPSEMDNNLNEEFTLSEIIGLGIDSLIKAEDWHEDAKPFKVRIDIAELQPIVKSAMLQKGAIILEVSKEKLTEKEIKDLEETLDSDNVIINFPNSTVAQNDFTFSDLRNAMPIM